tara:strand:- start:1661 stop:3253 length:1593 start_codon:yes stop_codon:yes gene_type:complete
MTGGVVSGFTGVLRSVKATIKSMGVLKVAIAATGIGALALAIISVGKAFTNSEEGQNKFRIIMIQISTVVGNVVDILANLGMSILNVGKAIGKLLTGDIKGAGEAFQDFKDNVVDAGKGVINFGKETREEIKKATKLQENRNKLDKIDRDLLVERAKANRDIAAARELAAAKEDVSLKDRMAAIEEAARLENEITQKEIVAAKMRLQARVDENSLAGSTKEDLEEEARLRAEVINLETSALKIQKALTAELTATKREAEAEDRAAQAAINAEKKAAEAEQLAREKELTAAQLAIRDALAITQAEKDALEIEKTKEKYDKLIAEAEKFGLSTVELEKKKIDAVNALVNKGAETDAKNQIFWEGLTQREKSQIMAQGLNNLATVLGKESAAGKAAAIAGTLITTYQSAQDSYKSLAGIPVVGPALGAAAAAAAVVAGMANVKAIKGTPLPTIAGVSAPSVSAPSSASQAPAPPAFNVVGATPESQLASTISSSQQKPVRAFVVSSDVSTQQELDRKTRLQAALGAASKVGAF